jgi:hypothetical protein
MVYRYHKGALYELQFNAAISKYGLLLVDD